MKIIASILALSTILSGLAYAAAPSVISGAQAQSEIDDTLQSLVGTTGVMNTEFAVWPAGQVGQPCKIENASSEFGLDLASVDGSVRYASYFSPTDNVTKVISGSTTEYKTSGRVTIDPGDRERYTTAVIIEELGSKVKITIGQDGQACTFSN